MSSFGPTQKIVLKGWSGSVGDGPIEQSGGRVDFFWVIYRAVPPLVRRPATISMKFGRIRT